jgi:hypothetical protein
VRITIDIDDRLLADAKAHAASSGRTLDEVVESALRAALSAPDDSRDQLHVDLPTFPGGRLLPGIDLDDSVTLIRRMEELDS